MSICPLSHKVQAKLELPSRTAAVAHAVRHDLVPER
jgi:hypothetical protein